MGYDIIVGKHHIYLTYNHCSIFQKYNIYPRNFNDMKVLDIIPFYKNAIEKLEELYPEVKEEEYINISGKYQTENLYANDERIVLKILYNVMDVLENYCSENDIWHSD